MTTLIEAYAEMNRRADVLAATGCESAGDDMPVFETQVGTGELRRDHVTLTQAERIAKLGRKTNVHLTVLGSRPEGTSSAFPTAAWFGGSALLREHALLGRSVHVEVLP